MSDDRGPDPHDKERPAPATPGPSGELQVPPQRQPTSGGPPTRPPYELVATPIPRPEPGRGERFTSWWSRPSTILIFVLVLVLLLISTTVFATLAITGGTPTAADPSPSESPSPSASATAGVATETPEPPGAPTGSAEPSGPAPSGSDGSGAAVSLPPPPADSVGVRYQSGAHEELYPGADQRYDFDDASEYASGSNGDVALTEYGVVGVNGVGFAAFRGKGRPQLGGCASIPREQWVLDIPAAQLKAGGTYCFVTTEGRYGYVTVQNAARNNAGELDRITFIFLVWEGPND